MSTDSDDRARGASPPGEVGPSRRAVAVRYRQQEAKAPEVTAKGFGTMAERILERAAENGVPIREDQFLADVLARLELGQEIPPETYEAMAVILAEIYRLDQEAGR